MRIMGSTTGNVYSTIVAVVSCSITLWILVGGRISYGGKPPWPPPDGAGAADVHYNLGPVVVHAKNQRKRLFLMIDFNLCCPVRRLTSSLTQSIQPIAIIFLCYVLLPISCCWRLSCAMSMRHKGIKEDCKSERFTHSNLLCRLCPLSGFVRARIQSLLSQAWI